MHISQVIGWDKHCRLRLDGWHLIDLPFLSSNDSHRHGKCTIFRLVSHFHGELSISSIKYAIVLFCLHADLVGLMSMFF